MKASNSAPLLPTATAVSCASFSFTKALRAALIDSASIRAWAADAAAGQVLPPLQLDVMATDWPLEGAVFDAIYCANMLHIAPWACCAALMQGAARHLAPGGVLITYGPYLEDEVPTSPGNLAFDADLRAHARDRILNDVACGPAGVAAADAVQEALVGVLQPVERGLQTLVVSCTSAAAESLLSDGIQSLISQFKFNIFKLEELLELL